MTSADSDVINAIRSMSQSSAAYKLLLLSQAIPFASPFLQALSSGVITADMLSNVDKIYPGGPSLSQVSARPLSEMMGASMLAPWVRRPGDVLSANNHSLLLMQMLPKAESASTLPPLPQPPSSSASNDVKVYCSPSQLSSLSVSQPIEAVGDGSSSLAPSTVSVETEPGSAELMIVCSELSRSFSSEQAREAVSVIMSIKYIVWAMCWSGVGFLMPPPAAQIIMLTASSSPSSLANEPALASAASAQMEGADRASEPRSATQIIQALMRCSSNGSLSSASPQLSCAASSVPLGEDEVMPNECAVAAQLPPVKLLMMALHCTRVSLQQVADGNSSPAAVSEFGRSDATVSRDQDASEVAQCDLEASAAQSLVSHFDEPLLQLFVWVGWITYSATFVQMCLLNCPTADAGALVMDHVLGELICIAPALCCCFIGPP